MRRALTVLKWRTLLGLGLGVAALTLTAASALAGNSSSPQIRSTALTTRDKLVDEFGPKYLLGYELKAAQR